jgi:diguanylate cyclase (GGDEF)-like protein
MPFRETAGDDSSATLALAFRALEEGQPQEARELAQSVLIAAKAGSDLYFEARALSCLAHCDRVSARLRRASVTSRTAARLFKQLGAQEEEATALTTLAHVSMLLGRNDEAVEAALLCVRLCNLESPKPQAVFAHNCLGLAYCWSGNFDLANSALASAIEIAKRCDPPVTTYQPRLNLAWVEAARLVDERYRTSSMQETETFARLVDDFQQLTASHDWVTISAAASPTGGTVSFVLASLLACWQGNAELAKSQADLAVRSLSGTVTWLDSLVHWVMAEIAWSAADWTTGESSLAEMKEYALAVEHEQLACVAHLLLAQVHELQGKHEAALMEHRALRIRERRMSSESLASRQAVVKWQLDARESERHLQTALIASKQFERWSLEDALTGIANRRLFEQTLGDRLQRSISSGRSLAVAMIDVDHFKAVNDTFSHQVGDRVLKTLASMLVTTVRVNDLAARLAGDEFVILFDDADLATAEEICQRIHTAVGAFDWNSVASGLAVSVSIGVGSATPGDTAETLLRRSDKSMYDVKLGATTPNR